MKKAAKISSFSGILIMLLAFTIPYCPYIDTEYYEDIVYFRFMMVGGICFALTSAITLRKESNLITNCIIAMGGGFIGLLLISTARLIYIFDTKWFFYTVIGFILIAIIIIQFIRLWHKNKSFR